VFCDKLVNNKDKHTVLNAINDISIESFGMEAEINDKFSREKDFLFADFLISDEKDEEGTIVQFGPRNYEAVSDMDFLRKRAYECMDDFNNDIKNTKKLELVLFNDALKHLLKIIRILKQPRSSGLLVGVGGSGKQSLTRLSAFIERMDYKQI
jgi:dynein heavy chain